MAIELYLDIQKDRFSGQMTGPSRELSHAAPAGARRGKMIVSGVTADSIRPRTEMAG